MARTFHFPRPRPRGLLGRRLEQDEQLVLGAGLLLGLFFLLTLSSIPVRIAAFLVPAGLSGWAVLAPWRGRTYLRWWEIRRTTRRLRRDGALLYRSRAHVVGRRGDGRPVPVEPPPGVPQAEWISARTAFGDLAICLQAAEGVFTCAVEVEPQQHFGGLDDDDKEALISAWELCLQQTANSGGRITRLQWISRVVPVDPNAHVRDARERQDSGAAQWLHDSYDQLLRQVAVSAEDRRLLLVLSIPHSSDLVGEAREYRSLHEGLGIILGREVEAFIRNLGLAQLRWVRNLDEAGLASWLHSQYDPRHWINDVSGMDRYSAWPAEIDAREATYIASRSWEGAEPWYSATAWAKQLPVLPVGINFLAPILLYLQDVILTVSVVMDLVPTDRALREAMSDVTVEYGKAETRAGKVDDPREVKERSAATAGMYELGNGAAGVRLACYVAVTAPSPELLRRHRDAVKARATQAGLVLEFLDVEQWRAFSNVLPFATGLLEEG
jgi:hypothetical protein